MDDLTFRTLSALLLIILSFVVLGNSFSFCGDNTPVQACDAIDCSEAVNGSLKLVNCSGPLHNDIFQGCGNLRCLDLSFNDITSLPTGIFDSLNLTGLGLHYNDITSLPDGIFDKLTSLARLGLHYNDITSLPPGIFDKLTSLTGLGLNDNDITSLPTGIFDKFTSLTHLDLAYNDITSLPSGLFDQLTSLTELYLAYNSLTTFDVPTFASLDELHTLRLDNCPISSLTHARPNTASFESITASLTGTQLRSPSQLNNMGLRAPAFVLSRDAHIVCYQSVNENIQITTHCTCETNFFEIGGRCVDLTPLFITLGIVFGALSGVLTLIFFRRVRRTRARMTVLSDDLALRELLIAEKDANIDALVAAWRIDPSELQLDSKIDEGAFGEVWRGMWSTLPVAIKILHKAIAEVDQTVIEEFEQEVDFLMCCRHINIVRFLGAGEREGLPFLVMEYLSRGSLRAFVHDLSNALDWPTRLRFAREMAAGLAHIHSLGQMHRDVKTANVLLDVDLRCKIADFGLVKQIIANNTRRGESWSTRALLASEDTNMTSGKGTPMYMAPEVMRGRRYDFSADVFSYAVTLWEIAARRRPDLERELELAFPGGPFLSWLEQNLSEGKRLPAGDDWPEDYVNTMQRAWHDNPDSRPSFAEIARSLGAESEEEES